MPDHGYVNGTDPQPWMGNTGYIMLQANVALWEAPARA